jgi:photosystem II stability/assembly factor-like uncharacterized protein
MRRWSIPGALALLVLSLGCHREIEMVPLIERTIYISDRFYDVQALGKDRAFVVGYGGKILETTDGGFSWQPRPSGVDKALYSLRFSDGQHAWIAGQDGIILHTADGGRTWERQTSHAVVKERDGTELPVYLFALDALDSQHAWAVGDRSVLTSTTDGGRTWRSRKVAMQTDPTGGASIMAADPILYDVEFVDREHGWVVGEFGKIMHTSDGGETWREQQESLMEGTDIFDPLDLPTLFDVHMVSRTEGFAVGLEGRVARTTDGERWTFDPVEVDYPLVDPLFRVVQLPDGTAWAVGAAGEVVRRRMGEAAWTRAPLGQDVLTWLQGISFSDAQHGWLVGGYGLIFRTTDGGAHWLPSVG